MPKMLLPLVFFVASFSSNAQTLTYESVRLSELLMESTWATQEEPGIPILIAGIEAQLKQGGASARASAVFPRELRKALTRENMGKAMAATISQLLTADEARDLHAFFQSPLGQKYLSLGRAMTTSTFNVQFVKLACDASFRELDATDRRSLEPLCGR